MRDRDLLQYIKKKKQKWDDFFEQSLKRVMSFRDYVYNTATEKAHVYFENDIKATNPQPINQLRTAVNRIKTDLRDLSPSLKLSQKSEVENDDIEKVLKHIVNNKVLTDKNISEMYKSFDDILDMSVTVARINVIKSFDEALRNIRHELEIENVPDIQNVFFDSSVQISKINESGNYVGYFRASYYSDDDSKKSVEVYEFWEKIKKKVQYGYYYNTKEKTYQAEKVKRGKKYLSFIWIEEVESIRHLVFENGEIEIDEEWPYLCFPFLIGFGVAFDHLVSPIHKSEQDRLTLVPFAEHAQGAQIGLDYAGGAFYHALKSSYAGNKYLVTPNNTKGHLDKWRRKSVSDELLHFNLDDPKMKGQPPFVPQVVPPPMSSPVVSEALNVFPTLLNQLMGVNLEQDITYNMSGEAIRRMQMVRSKNSKLYKDCYFNFINELGYVLVKYIKEMYKYPQVLFVSDGFSNKRISLNMASSTEPTNTGDSTGSINTAELFDKYDVKLELGRSRGASKEDLQISLQSLYQVAQGLGQTGASVIASTLDMYADSLSTSESSEIARRVKQYVPMETRELVSGEITQEQLDKQKQQQQKAAEQMQQQQFAENMALEKQKANADSQTAMAKTVDAQSKLKTTAIKANAEIIKATSKENNNA